MAQVSEDELIAAFFAPLAGPGGLGLTDDAALLAPAPSEELVLTKDILVAGVHFFKDDPPGDIARKALRVNLSDLAAKGAAPLGFLLGLALPEDWTTDWLGAFAGGLGEDADLFACPLLGGDTSKAGGPLVISITAIGAVPAGRMIRRAGVAAGDLIYVSGTIGDAALGLRLRLGDARDQRWARGLSPDGADYLRGRYLLPQPRLALRESLRLCARAAMDVSDGFAGDLAKMLRLTEMGADIALADVPLSAAAREALALEPGLVGTILSGGDDYELLCAIAPDRAAAFEASAAAAGLPVSKVGEARAGTDVVRLRDGSGAQAQIGALSYQHFRA